MSQFTDNFNHGTTGSGDLGGSAGDWAIEDGVWNISADELSNRSAAQCNVRYIGQNAINADQFAKMRIASDPLVGGGGEGRVWGFLFRAGSGVNSGPHYRAEFFANIRNSYEARWLRVTNNTTDATIETEAALAGDINDNTWIGSRVVGSGNDTVLSFWRWDADPDGGSEIDIAANWGVADSTMTTNPGADVINVGLTIGIHSRLRGAAEQVDDFACGEVASTARSRRSIGAIVKKLRRACN